MVAGASERSLAGAGSRCGNAAGQIAAHDEGRQGLLPCHDDTDPSLDITVRERHAIWRCRVCGDDKQDAIGDELRSWVSHSTGPMWMRQRQRRRSHRASEVGRHSFATDANGEQFLRKERFEYLTVTESVLAARRISSGRTRAGTTATRNGERAQEGKHRRSIACMI